VRKLLFLALLTVFVAGSANAQYFGQNKVQWEHFDFKVLKTEHFDIYYYDREADVVPDIGRMAERWYVRLSDIFNHTFARKPIVLYANAADFQQTTTTPELIGQGTGGFTDPFMNRVVMPLTGDYAENDHVLGHEMVHVFQFDVAASLSNNRRRFNLELLPLWLVEGMAEYLSKGRVDPLTAMWIRDATIRNRMPDLRKLNDPRYFPYRYGESLMAYIGGRFGDDAVVRYFLAAGLSGPDAAFERALGVPSKQIFIDWKESAAQMYEPVLKDRPANLGNALIAEKRGQRNMLNVGPALSPDGNLLAFLSTREIFDVDLFLADAHTGRVIRRLASAGRDPHMDALRFIDSAGAWSPDSKRLAFVTFEKGDNYLGIVNVDGGKIQHIRVPGVDSINNVAWSPDGKTIAMSAQTTAVSDLFLYDLDTNQVRRLTSDKYADLQPAFSPDGRTLAFVTDRGEGASLDTLKLAQLGIATIDIATGQVHVLPLFRGAKHINPQYSPDGNSLYFIANPEGVADVYRYSFGDGRVARVTRVQTGIAGITETSPALSVAARTGNIAVSLYEDDNYNIYTLPANTPGTQLASTDLPPNSVPAGQLPPLRGTPSKIQAYLNEPTRGLITSTASFTNAPYSSALHVAYVGPPTIGVGVSQFGAGVGGSVAAEFTDILGEHSVGFTVEGGGTSGIGTVGDQFAGEVFYLNQTHRVNWGADYTHLPYISAATGFVGTQTVNINGQFYNADVLVQQRQISRYDDLSGVIQYPFSTKNRVEFSAGVQHQSLKTEQETVLLVGDTVVDDETTPFGPNFSLNLGRASAAYVGDNAVFGFVSPLRGTRYRYAVEALTGDLHFETALADYRKYWFARPVTFAIRGIHYGRYGRDAESGTLIPLYLGQSDLVRGYEIGSINVNECDNNSTNPNACPVFDRLVGSRIAVANAELRIPLFGTKEFGIFSGFVPTEVAPFVDAGVAWGAHEHPTLQFQTHSEQRVPVVSAGVSIRMLLSYIPLEFYWAKPFQRPGKGLVFGFNIIPGW
jgi:Tol biopolymer transport system component